MQHKIRIFQDGKLVPIDADNCIPSTIKAIAKEIEIDGKKMIAISCDIDARNKIAQVIKIGRSPESYRQGIIPVIREYNRKDDNNVPSNK